MELAVQYGHVEAGSTTGSGLHRGTKTGSADVFIDAVLRNFVRTGRFTRRCAEHP